MALGRKLVKIMYVAMYVRMYTKESESLSSSHVRALHSLTVKHVIHMQCRIVMELMTKGNFKNHLPTLKERYE